MARRAAPTLVARAGRGSTTIDVHRRDAARHRRDERPRARTRSALASTPRLAARAGAPHPHAAAAMRGGGWDRKKSRAHEAAAAKTMGVVGLGQIGAHVAQLARAFGMSVVAHDPYLLPRRLAELGVPVTLARGACSARPRRHVARRAQRPDAPFVIRRSLAAHEAHGRPDQHRARPNWWTRRRLAAAVKEKRIGGDRNRRLPVEPAPATRRCAAPRSRPLDAASRGFDAEAQEPVAMEICAAVARFARRPEISPSRSTLPGIAGGAALKRSPRCSISPGVWAAWRCAGRRPGQSPRGGVRGQGRSGVPRPR